ncbi:unnamed protein product [Mycena citricolor]|uniref:Uncharacterized protein n=1 Tax=Mycena citricolor TaxID=2018698 RepID=A0AAD2HYE4_9AGAR|nr:unnamed protein product [Mycena citricolor]
MTTTVTVTVSQASTTAGVQKQRTHLMRSTRKLGALLGETPLIIDNSRHEHTASMSSMASRRSGMIFLGTDLLALPPPSPDGLKSVESSGAKMDRPMLFLRRPLPTLLSTAPSPQSPSFPALTPTTPLTPEPVVVDRRKKMAKLTRTLGVNPPAELVFRGVNAKELAAIPSPHYVSSVLAALGPANSTVGSRASMMSVESLASPTREATLLPYRATAARSASSLALPSSSGPWVNGGERFSSPPASSAYPDYSHKHARYGSTSSTRSETPYPAPPVATTSEAEAVESKTSRSTADARFLSRHFIVDLPERTSSRMHVQNLRALSPAVGLRSPSPTWSLSEDVDADADEALVREEVRDGWTGQWTFEGGAAGQDMQDVVKQLREMRL